jgi:hypothetical protein
MKCRTRMIIQNTVNQLHDAKLNSAELEPISINFGLASSDADIGTPYGIFSAVLDFHPEHSVLRCRGGVPSKRGARNRHRTS